MAVLEKKYGTLIAQARDLAVQQCLSEGTATTRSVRAEMLKLKILSEGGGRENWLGAVFKNPRFIWTGRWLTYRSQSRNVHERTIKIWRLTKSDDEPLNTPSPPPMSPKEKSLAWRRKVRDEAKKCPK